MFFFKDDRKREMLLIFYLKILLIKIIFATKIQVIFALLTIIMYSVEK